MINRYIRNCHLCQRAKAFKDEYHDELMLISIVNRSWKNISVDFVTDLLKSKDTNEKSYNTIMMIICRMLKIRHLISCFVDDKDTFFDKIARLLIRYVWKLHEFSKTIISDRDSQFISILWKILCKILEIKAKLSTAFHFETDDQSEQVNQNMKRFLKIYVNYQQDNWMRWLLMTEFFVNTCMSSFIDIISFLANYDFNSRINFDFIDTKSETTWERIEKRKTKNISDKMKKIWKFAIDNLTRAQINQKKFTDHHRKSISIYKSRNEVYLSTKNIQTERSSKKLNDKMLNLYSVRKSTQNNVQLKLSNFMKIHDTFHISLMKSTAKILLFKQYSLVARSIIINNEKEYKMNDILDFKQFRRKIQYKTSWMNHLLDRKWYCRGTVLNKCAILLLGLRIMKK